MKGLVITETIYLLGISFYKVLPLFPDSYHNKEMLYFQYADYEIVIYTYCIGIVLFNS